MRIGFDRSPLAGTSPGIARYVVELGHALRDAAPTGSVVPISHRRGDGGPRVPFRRAWIHAAMPLWLPRAGLDAVHWTGHDGPVIGNSAAIVTVHDVTPLTHPELHPPLRVARSRLVLRRLTGRAAAVITVSDHARRAIVERLDVDPTRVHVVPLAPAAVFSGSGVATGPAHGSGGPGTTATDGFLFVGTIEPRKNIGRILDAFALLHRERARLRLVIVGRPGWRIDLASEIGRRGLADMVTWRRDVDDAELARLMRGTVALLAPSIAEGFGLPIVEAMAAGLPVVTSHGGAQEETAGGAALLVDPSDAASIADAIGRLAAEPALRTDLRVRGLARAADFSWARTARETLAVYQSVVVGAGRKTA